MTHKDKAVPPEDDGFASGCAIIFAMVAAIIAFLMFAP